MKLILVNGPPGSGKSTLARHYADALPPALALDVDRVRAMVGGWRSSPGDAGLPGLVREPVFRVRARLESPSITAYGERWPLRSGLSAQADIALDSRPLYLWVIEPILRLRGRL